MQKLYSELIGMPVLTEYSPASVALVKDIIIDPDSGRVLAFRVNNQNQSRKLEFVQEFNLHEVF